MSCISNDGLFLYYANLIHSIISQVSKLMVNPMSPFFHTIGKLSAVDV